MTSFKSHLTVLNESAGRYPSALAFRVPSVDPTDGRHWLPISYLQFHQDVLFTANYWLGVLSSAGIPQGSVVGLWYVDD